MSSSPHVCPPILAKTLDNFVRQFFHDPQKILKSYVKTGMTVLDFGCGPGVFSIPIAKMVGPSGRVIAADLQPGMLEKVRAKIQEIRKEKPTRNPQNNPPQDTNNHLTKTIQLHQCKPDQIGLSLPVDFVLAFYTIHEIPDQTKFFREIITILKPGAKLLIIEPKFHVSKKAFNQTLNIAKTAGLKLCENPKVFFSYTAILQK